MNRRDVYQEVTDRILALLERGTIPWRQQWDAIPMNYMSMRPYSGVNIWLLLSTGYHSPYWLTYRQATVLGGNVRRGEHGTQIVFWRIVDRETHENGEVVIDQIPLLRSYTVFNVEQCGDLDTEATPVESTIATAEDVVRNYRYAPHIVTGGNGASYSPTNDTVHMPSMSTFMSPEAYYSVLYHEFVHSTGHTTRLNRAGLTDVRYASDTYCEEELIAEMGSAFLCAISGTKLIAKTIENSAAYVKHWVARLRDDRRLIVRASSHAQRASDWILGSGASSETDSRDAHADPQDIVDLPVDAAMIQQATHHCCTCKHGFHVQARGAWYCLKYRSWNDEGCSSPL